LYDSGIKTPLIVYYPRLVKSPAATDSLVSAIDLAPTILELASVTTPESVQGISFAAVLRDPAAQTRTVAFAEHNWHVYKNHERMVRTGDWLYIRNNFPNQQNLCVEAYMGGAGEQLWATTQADQLTPAQQNVFWNPCPAEELYHVVKDPHQLNNRAGQPDSAPVLTQMRELLAQWTDQTGDTVPSNPTPHRDAPPGQPKRKGTFQHLEMPGDARGAQQINHPGPR
jgi:arylsulfatase